MFIQTPNNLHCKFGAWQKSEPPGRTSDLGNETV